MTEPAPPPRPPRRASSAVAATCAAAGLVCVAVAAFSAGDAYDTPLYLLALVLLSAWAFLFLTGYRRRAASGSEDPE